MKIFLTVLLLNFVSISCVFSQDSVCSTQFQKTASTALNLSYEEYDQTPGQGLRSFSIDCQYEGALATIFYLENKSNLKAYQKKNLSFHIGQALASSGHENQSIQFFRNAKYTNNPSELLWNEYVEGTISFLKKDNVSLQMYISLIEEEKGDHWGNKKNLSVLKRLSNGLNNGVLYKDIDWTSKE